MHVVPETNVMSFPHKRVSKHWRVVLLVGLLLLARPLYVVAAPIRGNLTLDDGLTVVIVDSNAHLWPPAHVANLVLVADRSTKDDGVWVRTTKGLFQSGDRIFVTYKYLAWMSQGSLRGVWTLNPNTWDFRHYRLGPHGYYFPRNELVPGSASPEGQMFHWDQYSEGIEHTMFFNVAPVYPFLRHSTGFIAPNGQAHYIFDGYDGAEGVTYATGTRMAAGVSGQVVVDVSDGNDANGIQNWVDSQLGFIFRPDDIRVIWRFKAATAPVQPYNTFYWIWANYSFELDGTACDANPAPGTDNHPGQVYGEPRYFQSSVVTYGDITLPAGMIAGPRPRGTPCTSAHPGIGAYGPIANGTWIRWGEASSLAPGTPRWTLTHVEDPSVGTPIAWESMIFASEVNDGVWGVGTQLLSPVWSPGVWNTTSYVLSTQ